MVNHPNRSKKKFYAILKDRKGFPAEENVHVFPSQRERDEWVKDIGEPRARAVKAETAFRFLRSECNRRGMSMPVLIIRH